MTKNFYNDHIDFNFIIDKILNSYSFFLSYYSNLICFTYRERIYELYYVFTIILFLIEFKYFHNLFFHSFYQAQNKKSHLIFLYPFEIFIVFKNLLIL